DAARKIESDDGLELRPRQRGDGGCRRALMSAGRPMVAARREQHLDVGARDARAVALADQAEKLPMRRESLPRLRRRVVAEQQIGVARRRQPGKELHLRRAGPRRKNGDGRPQPESGPRRKQRKQRGERVERGEVEDEPVQVAAELERERRQRSRPPEDRHLHAALAARFVAGAKNGPLGRLDRLEKTQRLLLARERALAPRQRGGAHFLERVEGLEVIAVGLAQVLDERELAAAAVAGALRPEAVPAIEAFEKDRFSRERGARRECARGVASFE